MEGESIEVQGRTMEEAIRLALEQLGVSRDEVEVEVLAEGRAGVFGVGFQEARVRVTVLEEEEDTYNRRDPSEMVEVGEDDDEVDEVEEVEEVEEVDAEEDAEL